MAKLTLIEPNGNSLSYSIPSGTELLQAYKINPVLPLKFGCTKGQCAVCVFHVVKGQENLSKMTKQERKTLEKKNLDSSCRLACQCALLGDVTIKTSN